MADRFLQVFVEELEALPNVSQRCLEIVGSDVGELLQIPVGSGQLDHRFLELGGALLDPHLQLVPGSSQFVLGRPAVGEIVDHAGEPRSVGQLDLTDRQGDGKHLAVGLLGLDLPPDADDLGLTGFHVSGDVAVVLARVRLGHQDADVLSHQVLAGVAEEPVGGGVGGEDDPMIVYHDDRVHGGAEHGPPQLGVLRLVQIPTALEIHSSERAANRIGWQPGLVRHHGHGSPLVCRSAHGRAWPGLRTSRLPPAAYAMVAPERSAEQGPTSHRSSSGTAERQGRPRVESHGRVCRLVVSVSAGYAGLRRLKTGRASADRVGSKAYPIPSKSSNSATFFTRFLTIHAAMAPRAFLAKKLTTR